MDFQWPTTDELFRLAKEDPDALEVLRQHEVEALIASAPNNMQRRLRGLQFQIDAKRRASKTPMAACIAISQMMFDSVYELNNALNQQPDLEKKPNTQSGQPAAVSILRFPQTASTEW
ncbi:DUF3135 domain-containing protein [Marinagarivorans algicola]|uniref:DUF3135 domain-containing protein n=1 Tax=Marinagarivorans algicola TaxID=1513270 RepID=UPI0006B58200|nr:DUF3135 domain-containing protein [Marinagarivorans algicola]